MKSLHEFCKLRAFYGRTKDYSLISDKVNQMIRTLIALLMLWFVYPLSAEANCPTGAGNWNSCAAIDRSALSSNINPLISQFTVFDSRTISSAFNDPTSCNQQCLENLYQQRQPNSSVSLAQLQEQLVLRARVGLAMREISQLQSELRLGAEAYDFAMRAQSPRNGLTGDPYNGCPVEGFNSLNECANTDYGRAVLEVLRQRLGQPNGSLSQLGTAWLQNATRANREQTLSCRGGRGQVNYRDQLDSLLDQPITPEMSQVLNLIKSPQFAAEIEQAQAEYPEIDRSYIMATRIGYALSPDRASLGPSPSPTRIHRELELDVDRYQSLLRHPLIVSMMALPLSNRQNLTITTSGKIKDLIRHPNNRQLSAYLVSSAATVKCNLLDQTFRRILCPQQQTTPDEFAILTSYQEANPVEQIGAMALACGRGSGGRGIGGNSPVYIMQQRFAGHSETDPMMRSWPERSEPGSSELTVADTSFEGFAEVSCLNQTGQRLSNRRVAISGAYAPQVLRDPRALERTYIDVPITVLGTDDSFPIVDLSSEIAAFRPQIVLPDDLSSGASSTETQPGNQDQQTAPVDNPQVASVQLPSLAAPAVPAQPSTLPAVSAVSSSGEQVSVSPALPTNSPVVDAVAERSQTSSTNESQRLEEVTNQLRAVERRLAEARSRAAEGLAEAPASELPDPEIESAVSEQRTELPARINQRPARSIASVNEANRPLPIASSLAPVAEVTRSVAPAPVTVEQLRTIPDAALPQVIEAGVVGLAGSPSVQAASIRQQLRSLPAGRRSQLTLRQTNGRTELVDSQGQEVALESELTEIDLLSVLSEINSNPEFTGQLQIVGDRYEIVLNGRRIAVDPARITDARRRTQITLLVNEIALRRTQNTQRLFQAEILRRNLALSRQQTP